MSSLADGDRLAARSSCTFAAIRLPMMVCASRQEIVDPVRGNRAAFHELNPHQAQCTGQGVLLVVVRAELGWHGTRYLAVTSSSSQSRRQISPNASRSRPAQSLKSDRLSSEEGWVCMVAPPNE